MILSKQSIIELLEKNDKAVMRALIVLTERQTADEQASEATRHHNMRGFRPCHARMGTSMGKQASRYGRLSAKQLAYWRRPMKGGKMRIAIYAGQLLEVAREKNKQTVTTASRIVAERALAERAEAELAERQMQEMEARGDREQTIRDERNKMKARIQMEKIEAWKRNLRTRSA
jgi:hypothetical protein